MNGDREKSIEVEVDFTSPQPKKPQLKETGINCTVITRDVGTNYSHLNYVNTATNTSLMTKDSHTMTDDSPPPRQTRRKLSLTQIFNDDLKSKFISVGTQTISKITPLQIIEKRDTAIQTETETRTDCTLKNIFDLKHKRNRSVATSTQDLPQSNSINQLQTDLLNLKRTYSKYCQTKDVIVKDHVLCTKRACQTDQIPAPRMKETGVNTVPKKLIDASVNVSLNTPVICEKCQTTNLSNLANKDSPLSVSKIPRPKGIPSSVGETNKKKLMRQDTYVKIPAPNEVMQKKETADKSLNTKSKVK